MRTVIAAVLVLHVSASTWATVRGYDMRFTNRTASTATIQLTQYRSRTIRTERPALFDDDLRLQTKVVDLKPGESKVVTFNDAVGGFWVRWCNGVSVNACQIVDLTRDALEISID